MNNNDWLDIAVLEDYLDGKLDVKMMHQVERISLEDPFVAEALAGLSIAPRRAQSISLLQKQLQDRVAQKPVAVKRWHIASHRLSIAAAAAVLFIAISVLFWMRESNNRDLISANSKKKVEVAIAQSNVQPSISAPSNSNLPVYSAPALAVNPVKLAKKSLEKSSPLTVPSAADATISSASELENNSEEILSKNAERLNQESSGTAILPATVSELKRGVNLIAGQIVDENQKPIPQAFVKVNGTVKPVVTDAQGKFVLNADSLRLSKQSRIVVSSAGFRDKEIQFDNSTKLNISLDKIADANTNTMKSKTTVAAPAGINSAVLMPFGGWDAFNIYVKSNNRLGAFPQYSGRQIEVYFKIDSQGSPYQISVKKVSGEYVSQSAVPEEVEAMRLVKNGPKWRGEVDGSDFHQVNIIF